MRNKELVSKKLEKLGFLLTNIQRAVNTGESREYFTNEVTKAQDLVKEVEGLVEHQ